MKFINGMKDLSQAIVDKTVDVSQKSFKWVKDNRVEIIEYAAITILKSVVEVLMKIGIGKKYMRMSMIIMKVLNLI